MKYSKVLELCLKLVPAREPVLLVSSPGVGKSTLGAEVAKALGMRLVLMHPVVQEPVDSKGLPGFYDGSDGSRRARFTLTDDWRQLCETKEQTLVLVDDLGQASNAVQAPFMQWILAREVNGQRLSDTVTFIACTNRRGDAAGVQGLITPLLSRFTCVVNMEFDHSEWVKWAIDNDMPDVVCSFARFKPQIINAFKASRDMEQSPTPRNWSAVGRLLNLGITDLEAWAGAVGPGAAAEFKAYYDTHTSLPDVDALLLDPSRAEVPDRPDVLYALMGSLATRASKKSMDAIIAYIDRCPIEFAAVCLQDSITRKREVCTTKAFSSWAVAHKDVIF